MFVIFTIFGLRVPCFFLIFGFFWNSCRWKCKLAHNIVHLRELSITKNVKKNNVQLEQHGLSYLLCIPHFSFLSFLTIFVNSVFQFWDIVFERHELFATTKRYYLIPRSLHVWFRLILKFSNFSIVVIFHNFGGQSRVVFRFVVLSRALLVQNASLLTHFYLGNNYAHWKRMVKHISKFHFSHQKNVNVTLIENPRLAETAPVLLRNASELST